LFDDQVKAGDLRLFAAIPAQLSDEDKRSLLAIQAVLRERQEYAYLEIGSYLGGSLQPHVVDPRCHTIYSIDPRPTSAPDERGTPFTYSNNSTARMLALLEQFHGPTTKVRCFDADAREVDRSKIDVAPTLCFIDGEHTNSACFSDFQFCMAVAARPSVIVFHDAVLVYQALRQCLQYVEQHGLRHHAYILPDVVGVIELGEMGLFREAAIEERLAKTMLSYAHALEKWQGILREQLSFRKQLGRIMRRIAWRTGLPEN